VQAAVQQAHESLLHDVGGGVGRAATQQREAVQRTLVTAVQRRERLGLAGAELAQQVAIGLGGVLAVPGVGAGCGRHGGLFYRIPSWACESSNYFST